MRFKKLFYNRSAIESTSQIEKILEENDFHWLIDSEVEDAVIEIKNKTLIWHSGIYYTGRWHYGIFKSGKFFGIWENGIFENGDFLGKFISGIVPESLVQKKH